MTIREKIEKNLNLEINWLPKSNYNPRCSKVTPHLMAKNLLKILIACCLTLTIAISYSIAPAKADVIYQAFDMCYQDIKAELPKLKEEGFTYIQVSPPQTTPERNSSPCSGDDQWWFQYQPINYDIGNTLGSKEDLRELIEAAHDREIKVLVDVVLNHVADETYYINLENDPELQEKVGKPLFPLTEEYFHPKEGLCDSNRDLVINGWLGLIYRNDQCQGKPQQITPEILPDLKTESEAVRNKAKNYLTTLLVDLGADGLRFDAIKHIEPEYFNDVLGDFESDKYFYGEIIEGNPSQGYLYDYINRGIDITDYPLEISMVKAFRIGGDLRSLKTPQALSGVDAVTFARTHDTAFDADRPRDLCEDPPQSDLCFDDSGNPETEKDTFLGIAYVLGRQDGFPLIYGYDAENPITRAGVKFHQETIGEGQYFPNGNEIAPGADSPNLLFIERGSKGLAIINKAGNYFDVANAKMPGLEQGCYNELQYDFQMCIDSNNNITRWDRRKGIQIGPRTALFFIKAET